MAIDFPASPTNGQTFTSGALVYTYDGTKWTAQPAGVTGGTKIEVGNTKAEIVDTGSDGRFVVTTEGTERLRVNSAGEIGLAGANYGTSGQVLTSGGTGAAPTWSTPAAADKISEGNTSAEVIDTGSDGRFVVTTEGTERLRVNSSGNVGIGTTSPDVRLQLANSNSSTAFSGAGVLNANRVYTNGVFSVIQNTSDTDGSFAGLQLAATNAATFTQSIGLLSVSNTSENAPSFVVTQRTDTDTMTERLRVDPSGRLLVGTDTASGNNLLQVNTDASINGITVGKGASSISTNTALGINALSAVTTGSETVAVGHTAGASLTGGLRNVFVGYKAGSHDSNTLTTGSQCIFIGAYARPSAVGSTREHVFGYDIIGKGNSTTFIDNACYQGNNSSSWTTTSDQRLKKNITDNSEGLEKINQIRVVNFEYRPEEEIEDESLRSQAIAKEGIQLGVIAQELQEVCPECVIEQSTGVLSVVDDNIFWHMVNAVKELSAQNAALEARLAALEAS